MTQFARQAGDRSRGRVGRARRSRPGCQRRARRAARPAAGASSSLTSSTECPLEAVAVDAVDDQLAPGHAARVEPAGEEDRLSRRLGLGRGDDQEGRGAFAQQRGDVAGALGEAVDHARDRAEELRQIAQHVHAGDAREDREHERGGAAEEAGGQPAGSERTPSGPVLPGSRAAGSARRGSPARCATGACRARSRRSRARGAARTAWRSR